LKEQIKKSETEKEIVVREKAWESEERWKCCVGFKEEGIHAVEHMLVVWKVNSTRDLHALLDMVMELSTRAFHAIWVSG
jgi:hypothetical protein